MKPLVTKKPKSLRPTTGKVRESLFNILREKIRNSRFLDLYAGTGAVGLDALREGAAEVVFVEESSGAAKKISGLMSKFRLSEKAYVINRKVVPFIEGAAPDETAFDIIFLDPPYHTDEILDALSALGRSDLVRHEGIVIAEHFKKKRIPETCDGLRRVKEYRYGDSVLSIYEKV